MSENQHVKNSCIALCLHHCYSASWPKINQTSGTYSTGIRGGGVGGGRGMGDVHWRTCTTFGEIKKIGALKKYHVRNRKTVVEIIECGENQEI